VTESLIHIELHDNLALPRLALGSTIAIPSLTLTNGAEEILLYGTGTPVTISEPDTPIALQLAEMFRGPRGDVGTRALVSLTAGAMVPGHRVVMFDDLGRGIPADPTSPLYSFVGVSISGANIGGTFEAQLAGLIEEPSWSFTPLLPIFAGPNGTLTQARPWTGILHVIAVAQSPTSILVNPQTPITLSSV
jgi:hypothetical protein